MSERLTLTLEPCPFCGGSAVCEADNEDKEWYANTWWVECCDCGAQGPEQFNGEDRSSFGPAKRSAGECREAAIAAWNRRASLRDTSTAREGEFERLREIARQVVDGYENLEFDLQSTAREARAALAPSGRDAQVEMWRRVQAEKEGER